MYQEIIEIIKKLDKKQKKSGIILIVLLTISVLLETISIGLIFPLTSIIVNPDKNIILHDLVNINPSKNDPATLVLIFILFIILKFILLNYIFYKQSKFIFSVENYLSTKLFSIYLRGDYKHFHRDGPNKILHMCQSEMNSLRTDALIPGLMVISEGFIIVSIGVLLLAVDPISTLILIFIFYIPSFINKIIVKKKLLAWGVNRKEKEVIRTRFLYQILCLYETIKISSKEIFYQERYNEIVELSSKPAAKQLALQNFPRLLIEFLLVVGGVLVASLLILRGNSVEDLLPMMGLFAAAGLRIMPSVNRFYSGIQCLTYSTPLIKDLANKLKELDRRKDELGLNELITFEECTFKNVTFKYPKSNIQLNNISLKIFAGDYIGICGESGSGKSTFIRLLLGFDNSYTGKIIINRELDMNKNNKDWLNIIGYVPQEIVLIDGPIWSNIAIGIEKDSIDLQRLLYSIKLARLDNFIKMLPGGFDYCVNTENTLSGGERQRIGIARAIYKNPQILILDEATSSLDEITEKEFLDMIDELKQKITIVSITHRQSVLERCNKIYKISFGEFIET